MSHAVDAPGEQLLVEEVALDALGAAIEIDRPAVVIELGVAMDMWREVVENGHLVTTRQQGVDQMGADEARAASNQSMLFHSATPRATSARSLLPMAN